MHTLRSWRALLVREYLEHRIAFLYLPLGIMGLLALSYASALGFNRIRTIHNFVIPGGQKVFELGYLLLLAMWLVYLGITLFFYFGDAFSADRRNNAMFFWKSMPVSDLKILASKFLAGVTMFPLIILAIGAVTGLVHYLGINVATFVVPGFAMPDPVAALGSFVQITAFGVVYAAVALLWYAPFLAWVAGLSTIFGRWSLPLAFLIPGLLIVIENVALFGSGIGPRGGYIWDYISHRWAFGLNEMDWGQFIMSSNGFSVVDYTGRLFAETDWIAVVTGLVFAAVIIWLASEYRRRRIA